MMKKDAYGEYSIAIDGEDYKFKYGRKVYIDGKVIPFVVPQADYTPAVAFKWRNETWVKYNRIMLCNS